jgi:DNA replication protein DnaC
MMDTTITTEHGKKQEKRLCGVHGEYTATLICSMPIGKWFETGCPLCEKAEVEQERQKREKEELERRKRNREVKFHERGIPRRFKETTLSGYVADTEPKRKVLGIVNDYLKKQEEVSEVGRSLLLYGNVGTGKTRLATSIVKGWEGVGYYITAREYTRLVRSSYSTASTVTEQDIVDRFTDYSVLVIDEIGKQFATDNERFAIFEIINARYNEMKPTVLVSNMNMEDIEEFLGKATIDRIKENGGQAILFDWESYRSQGD